MMAVRDGNLIGWLADHHFDLVRGGNGGLHLLIHTMAQPKVDAVALGRDRPAELRRVAIKGLWDIRNMAEKSIKELQD